MISASSSGFLHTISAITHAHILQVLYLGDNHLSGNLPSPNDLPANITLIDLSNNGMSGTLPSTLPQSLAVLNVSGNNLTGALPSSWSTNLNLVELRLDTNGFTGTLPASWSAWGKGTYNSLQLSIKDTDLQGHVPLH